MHKGLRTVRAPLGAAAQTGGGRGEGGREGHLNNFLFGKAGKRKVETY